MTKTAQTAENGEKRRYFAGPVFAVAPMIDWTDNSRKALENKALGDP